MAEDIFELKKYFEKNPSLILEHPNMGLCLFYDNGKIIYSNQKIASIYQTHPNDMLDRKIQEFCQFTAQNLSDFLMLMDRSETVGIQEMYIGGHYYLYDIYGLYRNNRYILTLTLLDITAYKRIELGLQQANKQLKQIRHLNHVTGLNNFTAFEKKIEEINKSTKETCISMILVNLDQFKLFNQTYGFEKGDVILKQISTCLETFVQGNQQFLFHLDGDEFIFILPELQGWSLYTFAEQIRCAIYKLNLFFNQGLDQRLTVTLAIQKYISGIAFDHDFFLVKLKALLALAKQKGGNCWVDTDLATELTSHLEIDTASIQIDR